MTDKFSKYFQFGTWEKKYQIETGDIGEYKSKMNCRNHALIMTLKVILSATFYDSACT